MAQLIPTTADKEIAECLAAKQSFAMIAGAGAGKTTSLVTALDHIRTEHGKTLRQDAQRIACITYTNRAADVIEQRLGHDKLYVVNTLHSFFWREIKRFTHDIREAVIKHRIPQRIATAQKDDNGRNSKKAKKARKKVARLTEELVNTEDVRSFRYEESTYSNYANGELSHDDIVEIAGYLLKEKPVFRKALGYRYPFIFVDEAQDTFEPILAGLNLVGDEPGLPVVGYFGDPWQQIYEKRAGDFTPPPTGRTITKTENFRCSESVITLLNAFRKDVTQYAAGTNKGILGSVQLTLITAETPAGPRKTYTPEQLVRSLQRLDSTLDDWAGRDDVIKLLLARQMIARRLGFETLNTLFTGKFASAQAQDDYEHGEHFLLKPFRTTIAPLVESAKTDNSRATITLLRKMSPAFAIDGKNSERSLREVIELSRSLINQLSERWASASTKEILEFCREHDLVRLSDRLVDHLDRAPRSEEYDDEVHAREKGDWLCDEFFTMSTNEIRAFCDFIEENTAYSTQHGVKGEEYPNVLVVYDDTEAKWHHYSFAKLLTPDTTGKPTDGQLERSRKLAYVCFSRATEHLKIVLFTTNPQSAKDELVAKGLIQEKSITIADC